VLYEFSSVVIEGDLDDSEEDFDQEEGENDQDQEHGCTEEGEEKEQKPMTDNDGDWNVGGGDDDDDDDDDSGTHNVLPASLESIAENQHAEEYG
jgi:hypothetical protein